MKKVFLRLAKYTGIFLLFLFLTAFVWANWSEPTPGQMAPVVNFIPYDLSPVSDSVKIAAIERTVEHIHGVRGATYNSQSNLMSVAYGIDDVDQATIEATIQQQQHIRLHEKVFQQTGPRCPVGGSLTFMARVRHILCIRD